MAADPKKGRRLNARLYFEDESGFSERPTVRRTWAPRGTTPILAATASWHTRTVVGGISCTPDGRRPRFSFQVLPHALRAPDARRFIAALKRHARGRKVILLWDNLRAHKARVVRDAVRANAAWLTVAHFPPYAPELNPAEYVWSSAKRTAFGNWTSDRPDALDRHIRRTGRRVGRRTSLLLGCLRASGLFSRRRKKRC